MRFENRTLWIAVVDTVNTTTGEVVDGVGFIGPGKTLDAAIKTYSNVNPKVNKTHKGLMRLTHEGEPDNSTYLISPEKPALRPLNGAPPLAIRVSCMEKPAIGTQFICEIPDDNAIAQKRIEARETFGRDIHIKFKIGPAVQDGSRTTWPIEAVDDPFLMGSFNRVPLNPDQILIVGHFK